MKRSGPLKHLNVIILILLVSISYPIFADSNSIRLCKNTFNVHPLLELLSFTQKPLDIHELERNQRNWQPQNFTFPSTNPLPSDFRFLVHTVNEYTHSNSGLTYKLSLERLRSKLKKIRFISLSIVDEKHPHAYGVPIGFIVKVNEKFILAATPEDMRSTKPLDLDGNFPFPMSEEQEAWYLYHKNSLPSPARILANTKPGDYNEILVVQNAFEESPITIQGFFVKKGTIIPEEFLKLAREEKLPIIEIP